MQIDRSFFQSIIQNETDQNQEITNIKPIAGGDINEAYYVETQKEKFFIKVNSPEVGDLFEKEAKGMKLLREANVISVPGVIGCSTFQNTPYLVLEYIEKGAYSADFWSQFGRQLAQLHQITQSHFGLDHDNYIGKLPQVNTPELSWIDFFVTRRLLPQIEMAADKNLINNQLIKSFEALFSKLNALLPIEKPSLLHGDLWSGNFMCNETGTPSIYDPAVYFGHREIELAFTRLFGGFDQEFYDSYHEYSPLTPGFESRIDIYNLYPLLVHVNLFGPSYLSGIKLTLDRYS